MIGTSFYMTPSSSSNTLYNTTSFYTYCKFHVIFHHQRREKNKRKNNNIKKFITNDDGIILLQLDVILSVLNASNIL